MGGVGVMSVDIIQRGVKMQTLYFETSRGYVVLNLLLYQLL